MTPTPTATTTEVPTDTPTVTPTPTSTATLPSSRVGLSEILPAPADVDWDGDGQANEQDEWIELLNVGRRAVDLSGWFLDDGDENSAPYQIVSGTVLLPAEFALFYRQQTGLVLDDEGDEVRLIDLAGAVVDAVSFDALAADASYSRGIRGGWHVDWPPSPGAPNWPIQLLGPQSLSLPHPADAQTEAGDNRSLLFHAADLDL